MERLFKNASIARADSPELEKADVLVGDDGVIKEVGKDIAGDAASDCAGCVLVPGMFDLHVHAREPGAEHKETLATCADAALNGGITGLVLMPDTSPPIDTGNLVKSLQDLVSEASPIPMLVAGCLTKRREGEKLAGFSGMANRGVVMLTDSDRTVPCPDLLRRCMEYARDFHLVVTSHCDTPALAKAGAVNEGRVSYQLGLPGIPAISQEIAIDRDIRVAQHTGAKLHLQQISTAHALRAISDAKATGTNVTCEVSPFHLLLSEDDIEDYNTAYKLDPPLRLPADRDALLKGLLDDTVDAIATNHAPHTEFEKAADFASAPFGVAGLETAVLSLYDRFIKNGVFGWDLLIRKYSVAPREIVGQQPVAIQEGEKANFFVFDPEGETTVDAGYLKTKSHVSPFLGKAFAGAVRETVVG
ncbi:dihydroorotase [Verrucomicrobiales bacterium]|nr:dihydroorotase [Verrucomicrobiales bacterium]